MTDSCRPLKLEPGLAATYSKPSALMTSTMKSPPGLSVVRTSTVPAGSASRAIVGALAGPGRVAAGADCAATSASGPVALPTSAAPVTAALFRNHRLPSDVLRMRDSLHPLRGVETR